MIAGRRELASTPQFNDYKQTTGNFLTKAETERCRKPSLDSPILYILILVYNPEAMSHKP